MADRPTLLITDGQGGDETVELGPTTSLGRETGNDLTIDEMGVSRQHAEIVETEEGFALRDLNSSNGTFVNDQRITNVDYLLKDGDQIRLGPGDKLLVFRHPAAAQEPSGQPELVMQSATGEEEVLALGDTLTLGREEGNSLVVDDPGVSRQHAEIVQTEGGFTLRDLGSTNGTFVNQQRITDVDYLLKDGDQIQFGTAQRTFFFRHAVVEEVAPAPAQPEAAQAPPVQPTLLQPAVEMPSEADEPAEEMPAEPAATGLQALLERFRIRRAAPAPEAYQEPQYAAEDIAERPLSLSARISRMFRNLREDVVMRRRRRILTLTVENGITRAVVFEGPEVVAWGIADPADLNGSSDEDDSSAQDAPDDDGEQVGMLLSGLRAQRSRFVTELPLYVPLVRHLRLPEIRKRYLDAVVATEVSGSIPFEQDEVDIKWNLMPDTKDNEVMAIAVQKQVIDAHVDRLKQAGMGPAATFSQAAALAAAAGVPDAMVIHLGSKQPAIVLVRDGVPRAVHQVFAPEGFQNAQEQAEALGRAVEQMEGFNQTLATPSEGQALPLVLTGQSMDDGQLEGELRQVLQREVLPLSPPVVCPEGFPIGEYATNIGLTLLGAQKARGLRKAETEGVAASPNLLSPRHLPRPIPYVAIAMFLGLALMGAGAFNLTPEVDAAVSDAERKTELLVGAERQVKKVRATRNVEARLQNEARQARALTLEMKERLTRLEDKMDTLGAWFSMVETITKETPRGSRPPDVRVSDLKPIDNEFKLSGTAKSLEDAIQFADNIRDSGLFVNVSLRQVDTVGGATLPDPTGLESILGGAPPAAQTGPETGQLSFTIEATARPSTLLSLEDAEE